MKNKEYWIKWAKAAGVRAVKTVAQTMKNKEYWIKWAKAAGVRAVKTVAQTFVATIGTAAVLQDVNWVMVLSASALSGVISLATSVAGLPEVTTEETE